MGQASRQFINACNFNYHMQDNTHLMKYRKMSYFIISNTLNMSCTNSKKKKKNS